MSIQLEQKQYLLPKIHDFLTVCAQWNVYLPDVRDTLDIPVDALITHTGLSYRRGGVDVRIEYTFGEICFFFEDEIRPWLVRATLHYAADVVEIRSGPGDTELREVWPTQTIPGAKNVFVNFLELLGYRQAGVETMPR